jgi:hypothetical protein
MKGSSKGFIEIITIIILAKSSSEPELYNKFFFGVFFPFFSCKDKGIQTFISADQKKDTNVYFGRSEEVTTVCFPSPLFYQYYIH